MSDKNSLLFYKILLIVLFNSIIYGAINTEMYIDGEAHIRVDKDIRITYLKIIEQTQGSYETYKSDYSKDTTCINITLPNSNSSIVYEITIKNTKDKDYILSDIEELTYSNYSIKYELMNLEENQLIKANTNHTFQIKITTLENSYNQQGIINLKYNFISYEDRVWEFSYIGKEQEFIVPYDGKYNIELWGASGANWSTNDSYLGGKGAYTSGNIELKKDTILYIYVGEEGKDWSVNRPFGQYSFNGGSGGSYTCYNYYNGRSAMNHYGGSATDIRLVNGNWDNNTSLNSRIMVSSGGGGAGQYSNGGAGGGLTGYGTTSATGATQTEGGGPSKGSFGKGGYPINMATICNNSNRHGASSGYYGGGVSNITSPNQDGMHGGGSGSSFISGHTGCVAITSEQDQTPKVGCTTGTTNNTCSIHYSNKVFTNTKIIDGSGYNWTNIKGEYTQMPSPDGKNTIIGNIGNGYAKITLLNIKTE